MGAVFALFSGWYFWIPKILGLDYNLLYSKAHFWVLFAGVNLTFFPQHFLGLQGMPRRISDYPDAFTGWNFISSIGSIISVAATALFLHIVYLQLVKGKAIFGYAWALPQLFSDYLRILKDKSAPGLEWALHNPPKPHAFTSLPLQSGLFTGYGLMSTIFVIHMFVSYIPDISFIGVETVLCDAPRAWGLYFQDSASPQMEALVELHDNIMYYLVGILFSVGWIQAAIIRNFGSFKSPISNKYVNHGKCVPIQKYSNYIQKKHYSTSLTPKIKEKTLPTEIEINIIKLYENATLKKQIIDENKNKSGIYLLTNLLNKDKYVGQSIDLGKRFTKYFTLSYLKNRNTLVISRALIKYGYANFSISILEYCDKDILNEREQYYMDIIKPVYNTLKIAGSSSGYKHTQESKDKRSLSLKGKYIGTNSPLYGRTHTEQTKELMSSMRKGQDNYFYGKTHTDETRELMKQKATGRKHLPSTLEKMSKVKGNPVNVYEKCNSEGFKLIGNFISARKAGLFLGISGSTIIKYMHSGEIFKDRYKLSGQAPK
jgi:group I intron endonuclease